MKVLKSNSMATNRCLGLVARERGAVHCNDEILHLARAQGRASEAVQQDRVSLWLKKIIIINTK